MCSATACALSLTSVKANEHSYLRLFEGKDLCVGEHAVRPTVVILNALLHGFHRREQTKGDCHLLFPLLFVLSNVDYPLYLVLTGWMQGYPLTERRVEGIVGMSTP